MWSLKSVFVAFGIAALLSIWLAACAVRSESSQTTGVVVHMGSTSFFVSSVTLTKGESLTLTNNASDEHIITNGTWSGSVQKPAKEPGAPTVNLTFNGQQSQSIGPFNTAGTFHIYCTIHQGMKLDVIVPG